MICEQLEGWVGTINCLKFKFSLDHSFSELQNILLLYLQRGLENNPFEAV